jgi:hypothetical protein
MKNMDAAAAAAAAAAVISYTISDEFSTRELAHAWSRENIAFDVHQALRGPNRNPFNVNERDINGNRTANTHMSSNQHRSGNCEPIVPLTALIPMGNLSRWGEGVRCVPVISSTNPPVNHYVIVYKPAWLKSVTEAGGGAAATEAGGGAAI